MYIVGHRVILQTQPELGLGLVVAVDERNVEVLFSATGVVRTFVKRSAPLKRMVLSVGQKAQNKEGQVFVVEKSEERDGLFLYFGTEIEVWEYELHHKIEDVGAATQFLLGQWSSHKSYPLRREGWKVRGKSMDPDIRGLVGGRVSLLPHQFYVASQVSGRELPRVLLADEVGLGKTIEAGLIYSSLKAQGRASKVLIVVPDHLKHQWLAELYRRFNDMFTLLDEERSEEEELSQETSPFAINEKILCSFDFLMTNLDRLEQAQQEEWDLLIIDEAHHLSWHPEEPSLKWMAARALSVQTEGLLLITATPQLQGIETQFGLLNLVDPERFGDFDSFCRETEEIKSVASLARSVQLGSVTSEEIKELRKRFKGEDIEEGIRKLESGESHDALLRALVDRHGTGRVLMRNRRERLKGFPERKLISVPLAVDATEQKHLKSIKPDSPPAELMEIASGRRPLLNRLTAEGTARGKWLLKFIEDLGEEKALLICSTPKRVKELEAYLTHHSGVRKGVFHEELEIVERDRQAAWFAQPDGAQILLCSEIGGEGRNFQFAHKLILFDLPAHPDLLEQRIGRLDRIGQKRTIEIYVPWLEGTPEEALFRWYHEGLNSFETAWTGGAILADEMESDLLAAIASYLPKSDKFESRSKGLNSLLKKTSKRVAEISVQRQRSVDTLVDINSYDETIGHQLTEKVDDIDHDPDLRDYMEDMFDYFGVHYEELDSHGAMKLKAGRLAFVEHFPELPPGRGKAVTFDRNLALSREELVFITQDHPMVQGALGLLLDRDEGRASICVWEGGNKVTDSRFFLQCLFLLDAPAPAYLAIEKYLPLKVVEVVMDEKGEFVSDGVDLDGIRFKPLPQEVSIREFPTLETLVGPLLKKATQLVEDQCRPLVKSALENAELSLNEEHQRLEHLSKVNDTIPKEELLLHGEKRKRTLAAITDAAVRLDAVRMILVK